MDKANLVRKMTIGAQKKGDLTHIMAKELNSVLGKKGRRQMVWGDGVIGTTGMAASILAPASVAIATGRDMRLDGRKINSNDKDKTVIEVPVSMLEKKAGTVYPHNYIHYNDKTILRDGIISPALKGVAVSLPLIALSKHFNRNLRYNGEKIDTSDKNPVEKGKVRIIIEKGEHQINNDDVLASEDNDFNKIAEYINAYFPDEEVVKATFKSNQEMEKAMRNAKVDAISKKIALPLGVIGGGVALSTIIKDKAKKKERANRHYEDRRPSYGNREQRPYQRRENRPH